MADDSIDALSIQIPIHLTLAPETEGVRQVQDAFILNELRGTKKPLILISNAL